MRFRFVMRCRPSVGGVSADGTPNGANGMRIGFGSVKPEPIMPTKSVETAKKAKLRSIRPCTRSEEHTSELQSLMRSSYAVFCLKKKKKEKYREKETRRQ